MVYTTHIVHLQLGPVQTREASPQETFTHPCLSLLPQLANMAYMALPVQGRWLTAWINWTDDSYLLLFTRPELRRDEARTPDLLLIRWNALSTPGHHHPPFPHCGPQAPSAVAMWVLDIMSSTP